MQTKPETKQLVRVWNVPLKNGSMIKAVTIEQGARKKSMCEDCPSPCCKGMFYPILTQEEFLNRKFKTTFLPIPQWLKKKVPRAQYIVTLAMTERGCPYHDFLTNKCLLWPNCPQSCLSYDCRDDFRPEIKDFVKRRQKEW